MIPCSDIRKRIRDGHIEDIEAHLSTCPSCAAFAEAYGLLGTLSEIPETGTSMDLDRAFGDLQKKLSAQIPVRRSFAEMPTWIRLLITASVGLLVTLLVRLLVRRVDSDVYPMHRWMFEVSAMGIAVVAALTATLRPMHRPRYSVAVEIAFLTGISAVLLTPLLLPEAHGSHPASLQGAGEDLFRRAVACFGWGTAVGAVLGVPVYLASRGAGRLSTVHLAFWLLMGIFAQLVLHLHCPIVHPLHIALGHTVIVPVLLLIALILRFADRQ